MEYSYKMEGHNNDNERLERQSQIKILEKMKFMLLDANSIRHELNELIENNLGKIKSSDDQKREEELTEKLLKLEDDMRMLQIGGVSVSLGKIDTFDLIDQELERLRKLL